MKHEAYRKKLQVDSNVIKLKTISEKNITMNTKKNAEIINEVIKHIFHEVTTKKISINQEATQVHLHTKF